MKRDLVNAILSTLVLTFILGLLYPLAMTGVSQVLFRENANGQLIYRDGQLIGSKIIGQPFTGVKYFHSRPSAAGNGYDAGASSGSNLGPTSAQLVRRVNEASNAESAPVPIDLVTASGSGLDPDITPAAAYYQAARVARERSRNESDIRALIEAHIIEPQFGIFGESRVNVLQLNLDLDRTAR